MNTKMLTQNITDKTKSTIIRKACPFCSKTASIKSTERFNNKIKNLLECGHTLIEQLEEIKEWKTQSISGKTPFAFQYKTLDFITKSNFRTGIFHEQGVGKTICALIAVAKYPEKLMPFAVICKSSLKVQWWKEILDWTGQPAQIISNGSDKAFPGLFKAYIISYDLLKNKTVAESIANLDLKLLILDECQQIKNSNAKRTQALRNLVAGRVITHTRRENQHLNDRPRIEMIANDLMRYHGIADRFVLSFVELEKNKLGVCCCRATKDGIIKGEIKISDIHAKNDSEDEIVETILHEIAHAITPGAGHKKIWSDTSLAIGGDGKAIAECEGTIEDLIKEVVAPMYIFALSGMPIKNHAGEYFPVLNILKPELFHSQAQFERDYCDTYSSGFGYKIGGLNRYRTDEFKRLTDPFITRYERSEVLPDLPKIFRKNFFVELGAEVEKAYKAAYLEFRDEFLSETSNKFEEQGNLLAKLNRMRHLTGIAKVLPMTEFVEEFLGENERKICLFVHHKDVGLGLLNNITKVCTGLGLKAPLSLTSENAGLDSGMRIDEQWKSDSKSRVMIASTLSAGEGKNWQMCSDAIIVERQWNPANEEQAEGRFPRPGISKEIESISITYALALGTPDEYLAEIVERKREICKKTMGNEAIQWNQSSVIKELSEILISKGGKRWNL